MTNIHGNRVLTDSDALIGLINETDALHKRCRIVLQFLSEKKFKTITPYPIVLEAATALAKDKLIRRPDLAYKLLQKFAGLEGIYKFLDLDVSDLVVSLYKPKTSKKNSPFDYYLLALAKKNKIKYVFSFDSFYEKRGLILIESIIK